MPEYSKKVGDIRQLSPATDVRLVSKAVQEYLKSIGHTNVTVGKTVVWVRYGQPGKRITPVAVGGSREEVELGRP